MARRSGAGAAKRSGGGGRARKDTLAEYRAKRDFGRTPEPSGRAPRGKRAATKTAAQDRRRPAARRKRGAAAKVTGRGAVEPTFCVQKHLASHLHYDFRLEHAGVMLSWAVPKGPSLRPGDKRLAMRVEDHPREYGEFEGVIPSGYGAGVVMLWDRGTWTPEPGFEDIDRALEGGELKFRLDGVKLKGSWVLVRTGRGAGDGRAWLLIKHRDEWAGDLDVTEVAPQSVKSFGDLADILAAEQPETWESHLPERGGAAGKMLAEVVERAAAIKAGREKGAGGGARRGRSPGSTKSEARKPKRARSTKEK